MATITDGTAQFVTRDMRYQAIFDMLYPIGIIVSTVTEESPFEFGTWEEISAGRVLQGATAEQMAGETVEAGLPNIKGSFSWGNGSQGHTETEAKYAVGCFNGVTNKVSATYPSSSGTSSNARGFTFDASASNSIYGNSDTVQPPAYLVHFWRRTA